MILGRTEKRSSDALSKCTPIERAVRSAKACLRSAASQIQCPQTRHRAAPPSLVFGRPDGKFRQYPSTLSTLLIGFMESLRRYGVQRQGGCFNKKLTLAPTAL